MAIGDNCRSSDDCNSNTFFDTALVCFNGTCVESFGGGITVTPTPTPTSGGTGNTTDDGADNLAPKKRCCGPSTNYVCRQTLANSCPPDTSECDEVGSSCAPYCNMKNEYTQCATLLGNEWTGEATRTVNVLVNGSPTPVGCISYPGVPSDWDRSECIKIVDPPKCPPLGELLYCENGYNSTGATNAVLSDGGVNGVCGIYRENNALCDIEVICDPIPPYFKKQFRSGDSSPPSARAAINHSS